MTPPRTAREILAAIDAAVRRFQSEHLAANGGPCDVSALRLALGPLRREMDEALVALETDTLIRRLSLELGRLFAARSAPHDFCLAALQAIRGVMRASTSSVLTFAEDGAAVVIAEQRDDGATAADGGLSRSMLNDVIARKVAVRITDALDSEHGTATSVASRSLRSVLIAPLLFGDRVGGAIYLENSMVAGAFTESDRVLLESIAQLLSPYVQVGGRLDAAIEERNRLHAALEGDAVFHGILGRSPGIRRLVTTIERLKDSDAPVLVEGESGTGKELVARALHASGRRAAGPFSVVNCAAIPEGLMESELLGHERGAFTGATERRIGRFEQAHRGTLFLDEVGELRLDLQAKLLRVLQEQSFERVGGTESVKVDVRVVAATNRDLRVRVAEGQFRADLFYRLHVVPLMVPSLRERPEDIPLLAEAFLDELSRSARKSLRFGPGVVGALQQHPFPGNVRELRNLVHRLVALAPGDTIELGDLPTEVTGERSVPLEKDPLRRFLRQDLRTRDELQAVRARMQEVFAGYLRQVEARFLKAALERAGGNVSEASRATGINRTALHRRLRTLADDAGDP